MALPGSHLNVPAAVRCSLPTLPVAPHAWLLPATPWATAVALRAALLAWRLLPLSGAFPQPPQVFSYPIGQVETAADGQPAEQMPP
jgi:hypothetical protein